MRSLKLKGSIFINCTKKDSKKLSIIHSIIGQKKVGHRTYLNLWDIINDIIF